MKKILYSSFAVLFAASVLASCNKEINNVEPKDEELVEVTIIAGNPTPDAQTKTEMDGSTPKWSVGDAIGVSNGTSSNNKFSTSIASPSTTASFTGSTSVSGDLYAYYPHSSLGVAANGAKVEIFAKQYPKGATFDGASDVMFSKPFTVSPAGTTVNGLEFARAGAILKLVFKDNTTGGVLAGQKPNTVSLTSTTANLAGRLYLDLVGQSIGELYSTQSKTVSANYLTTSSKFAINGTNAAYIIVYPQTLAAGENNLTIAANTELYSISKTVSVPVGGINLEPGKITTLNVTINDANVSSDPAPVLPFTDNFAWQTSTTADTEITSSSDPALPVAKYFSSDKVYTTNTAGVVRVGSSSTTGSLTTIGLNLNAASHITVSAKKYGSDASKIMVSVDGGDPITATNDAGNLGDSFKDYVFDLPASTAKSRVTIATSSKRAYINGVTIEAGAYVPPSEVTPPYNNTLISGHSDFTVENVNTGSLEDIWTDTTYGTQASAYGTTSDVETYLVSPTIDLTGVDYALLTFSHSTNFFADVAKAQEQTALQVKVGDGAWTNLAIPTYPASMGNSFVDNSIYLDAYCGKKIKLRFKYLATSTNPGRWQIKNFSVIEINHSLTATPKPAVIGGTSGNSVSVTATSYYALDYSITETGAFTVSQSGKVFTITATADGGGLEAKLGTVRIKEAADASRYVDVEIRQSAKPSGPPTGVIYHENFGNPSSNTAVSSFTGWEKGGSLSQTAVTYSYSGSTTTPCRTSSPSSGYTGASGQGCIYSAGSGVLTVSNINVTGAKFITFSCGTQGASSNLTVTYKFNTQDSATAMTPAADKDSGWGLVTYNKLTVPSTATSVQVIITVGSTATRIDDLAFNATTE